MSLLNLNGLQYNAENNHDFEISIVNLREFLYLSLCIFISGLKFTRSCEKKWINCILAAQITSVFAKYVKVTQPSADAFCLFPLLKHHHTMMQWKFLFLHLFQPILPICCFVICRNWIYTVKCRNSKILSWQCKMVHGKIRRNLKLPRL